MRADEFYPGWDDILSTTALNGTIVNEGPLSAFRRAKSNFKSGRQENKLVNQIVDRLIRALNSAGSKPKSKWNMYQVSQVVPYMEDLFKKGSPDAIRKVLNNSIKSFDPKFKIDPEAFAGTDLEDENFDAKTLMTKSLLASYNKDELDQLDKNDGGGDSEEMDKEKADKEAEELTNAWKEKIKSILDRDVDKINYSTMKDGYTNALKSLNDLKNQENRLESLKNQGNKFLEPIVNFAALATVIHQGGVITETVDGVDELNKILHGESGKNEIRRALAAGSTKGVDDWLKKVENALKVSASNLQKVFNTHKEFEEIKNQYNDSTEKENKAQNDEEKNKALEEKKEALKKMAEFLKSNKPQADNIVKNSLNPKLVSALQKSEDNELKEIGDLFASALKEQAIRSEDELLELLEDDKDKQEGDEDDTPSFDDFADEIDSNAPSSPEQSPEEFDSETELSKELQVPIIPQSEVERFIKHALERIRRSNMRSSNISGDGETRNNKGGANNVNGAIIPQVRIDGLAELNKLANKIPNDVKNNTYKDIDRLAPGRDSREFDTNDEVLNRYIPIALASFYNFYRLDAPADEEFVNEIKNYSKEPVMNAFKNFKGKNIIQVLEPLRRRKPDQIDDRNRRYVLGAIGAALASRLRLNDPQNFRKFKKTDDQ